MQFISLVKHILNELSIVGKYLDEYSLGTVELFRNDELKTGFSM